MYQLKFITLAIVGIFSLISCGDKPEKKATSKPIADSVTTAIEIAHFKGQQVTGVTVTDAGRIFANFPRWRTGVNNSVIEVFENDIPKPYPSAEWNTWEIGNPVSDSTFVAVQSVVAKDSMLYVLDTRNPLFKSVIDAPRVFVFNLHNNSLRDILILTEGSYKPKSYINDLRIDTKNNMIYFTDSAQPGLVVYNLKTKESKRVLDGHFSTSSEVDFLTFHGEKQKRTVHSDGIALKNDRLYYHALTGYSLFSVPVDSLINGSETGIEKSVTKVATTGAPDGMIFDQQGNLYLANLEKDAIDYLTPKGELKTLLSGAQVKWADSFSIFNGYLYYTNSRINEVKGTINDMEFTIYKVKI
ncbi:hypothetical protein NBRC110019_01050 [Neptunitalea chrysea]|uniref:Major royal jelly protein n=1 Tax=Neptunitalea chrysea TaxID=1647581 RepID=A0A9W6ETZ2_9FLAO|nr:L-dopachrome tautomerase-related protein [Neptunitalea chrysea]GLB51066.1 hypothetical protein NBRC110019_01050 [Neptunitalea chrysea]